MPIEQLVTLRNGTTLPLEAMLLAWNLEGRGFRFETNADDDLYLRARPFSDLTMDERVALRRWRDQIVLIVNDADSNLTA